ncbi:hypothetical protein [Paraburkholderia sediminicola]|uniref:hypothetical protein n=1 Tax=Paraburkholderia sediminicola TaxID=458836 RepID=UPI0038BBE7CB
MFAAPIVVAAVQAHANSSALGGISGSVLVYLGSFALFGLIGLVPMLAGKPPIETPPPQWTVVDKSDRPSGPAARQIETAGMTIDADFTVFHEPPRVTGQDPRWGR